MAYTPLLNPYDLVMVLALFFAARSLSPLRADTLHSRKPTEQLVQFYKVLLALSALVLTTCALIRGVHHFTGVPWDSHALFNSIVVQTVLSIYWGSLAFPQNYLQMNLKGS